jgi:hypothetical protein
MGTFLARAPMVGCHAHIGVVVEDSYSLMMVRLAGLIPIGVFLLEDHPFRNEANVFCKNTKVFDEAPRYITGEEVQAHVN